MRRLPFALLIVLLVTLAACAPRHQDYDPLADLFNEGRPDAAPQDFDALRAAIHQLANEAVQFSKEDQEEEAQDKIDRAKVLILTFEGSEEQREQLAAEYDLLLALLDEMIDPDSRAGTDVFQLVLPPEPTAEEMAQVEAARSIPNMQRYLRSLPKSARRRVAQQLAYFTRTKSGRQWFQRSLNRSAAYRAHISEVLARYELPAELMGVALIESGFSERAISHAGAAGMWQFMPATARYYGMTLDGWIDQRYDWTTATDAAARYLRDSMKTFNGDIELSVASYNTGAGNVNKAIRRARSQDYWKLRLHSETMAYVPKWIAAMIVYYNPKKYGFHVPPDAPQQVDTIRIRGAIELGSIAGAIGEHPKQIFALNRALIRKATPPDRPWDVRLPKGSREQLLANLDSLMQKESVVWVAHRLRANESLGTLSKMYGVSVERLMNVNTWLNESLPKAGEVIMVPVQTDDEKVLAKVAERERAATAAAKRAAPPAKQGTVKTYKPKARSLAYKVRRRDTLWSISQRYGVSVKDLRAWNKGKIGPRDRITIGQTLTVRVPPNAPQSPPRRYTVRRGDTLGEIARRHKVTTKQLATLNDLSTRSTIYPGTVLQIPGSGSAQPSTYKVRSGDTLSGIAGKFGLGTGLLAKHNGMKSNATLYAGKVLKIPGGGSPAAAPRIHVVKKGDTFSSIASRQGVNYRSLAAYNGMKTSSTLHPGMKLKIPPKSWKPTAKKKSVRYKVRPGDSLTKVARRFGCSVADLERWNNIKRTSSLRVGHVLVIYK
ncbi:MAG: LysM peptidoglycan-binding domain-containing protein [Candidatus Lernaella stagnicola]|nr:LysM peptidoglycan-binding domain-containing protein [Candidatus Lernaella stagnicola]